MRRSDSGGALVRLLALLLLPAVLFAIDGTVTNKTTGLPQAGVLITLTKMGQGGMQPAGTAKTGADGKFKIDASASDAHLLQALFQGVSYSTQVPPGTPGTNIQITVYNAVSDRTGLSGLGVEQDMILIETDGKDVVVNQSTIFRNSSDTAWNDPKRGTFRFAVPAGVSADNLKVRALTTGGMPVERPAQPGGAKGAYFVDYPVRPGQTRFDVSYKFTGKDPLTLKSRVFHEVANVRVVAPKGVTLQSAELTPIGTEPTTQAQIFQLKSPEFTIAISGSGSISQAQPAAESTEEEGPRIEVIQPPGYQRQWKWILGLTLALLAIGFYAQFVKGSPSSTGGRRQ
jgi:hypothetical protein